MKRLFVYSLLISACLGAQAQQNYYVNVSSLNFRGTPDINGDIIQKLSKHDNLILVDSIDNDWVKVKYAGIVGYVSAGFVKKGRAVVDVYSYRVGAVCKDGTSSSATGRGACSHHGGVSYWKTKENRTVRIVNQ